MRRAGMVEDVARELRHAARRLMRSPAFTIASVLTLALAISANAAIIFCCVWGGTQAAAVSDRIRLINLDHGLRRLINVPTGMGMKVGLYYYYSDRARTLDGISFLFSTWATRPSRVMENQSESASRAPRRRHWHR